MEITVTVTPSEMMDKWFGDKTAWELYCERNGINVYAVSEGRIDSDHQFTMSYAEAQDLGIVLQEGEL